MDINFWSVLVASVVAFIVSALWYSPILFGKEWMALTGYSDSALGNTKSKIIWFYIVQLIITIVSFCILGFAMTASGISTASDGAIAGILAWLGFQVPLYIGALMWEGRPGKLILINLVCGLLIMVIGGAIIGAW